MTASTGKAFEHLKRYLTRSKDAVVVARKSGGAPVWANSTAVAMFTAIFDHNILQDMYIPAASLSGFSVSSEESDVLLQFFIKTGNGRRDAFMRATILDCEDFGEDCLVLCLEPEEKYLAGLAPGFFRRRRDQVAVLNQIPIGLAIFDRDLFLRRLNPEFVASMPKYSPIRPEHAVGTHLSAIFPSYWDQFHSWLRALFDAKSRGGRYKVPFSLAEPGKAPSTTYWNLVANPLLSPAGEVEGVLLLVNEVSGDVAARQKMIAEQNSFRDMLENLPGVVYRCRDRSSGFATEFASKGCLRLTGFAPDALLGRNALTFFGMVHPDYAERVQGEIARTLDQGLPLQIAFRAMDKSGQIRTVWNNCQAAKFSSSGPVAFEGIFIDVGERFRQEAIQPPFQGAGAFFANISREIRSPLNGILGMANLLGDTSLDETQGQFVDAIRMSAESMQAVVDDVLDFSRLEDGALELDNIEFSLCNVLEDVCEQAAKQARTKGLEVVLDIRPDCPVHVAGDPERLRQILSNLMDNAVKFTDAGEVTLRSETVSQDGLRGRFRFSVADTGIGIDSWRIKEMFAPFSRTSVAFDRRGGGSGLGLAISKRLAKLMGGELAAESQVGEGSTFSFTACLELSSYPEIDEADTFPGVNILLVESNSSLSRVLAGMLQRWGCQVRAADAASALAIIHEDADNPSLPFDVVILERRLSDSDGKALAWAIRGLPGCERVPLFLLTESPTSGTEARMREDAFLTKLAEPVRKTLLQSALRSVLDGSGTANRSIGASSASSRRWRCRNLRILVADDNEINRKVVAGVLTKHGYRVQSVADGRAVLEALASGIFDLVLMDCLMPEMNGYEAAEKIRAREKQLGASRIPIIALSNDGRGDDFDKCTAAGMDDCVIKPIIAENLLDAIVRNCFDGEPEGRPPLP